MIEVKSMNDIQKLREQGILPEDFLGYLEMFLYELYLYLEDGEGFDDFDLDGHGYFVILEANDDIRNLGDAGLNPEDDGLLGCCPERADGQGNRKLYELFHDLAARQICCGRNKDKPVNAIFYDYYQKKLKEGKTKHQAIISVMRRLVNIIYGMMKNKTEYVHPTLSKETA